MIVGKDSLSDVGVAVGDEFAEAPPAYEDHDAEEWAASSSQAAYVEAKKAPSPGMKLSFGRFRRSRSSTPPSTPPSLTPTPSDSPSLSPSSPSSIPSPLWSTISALQSKKPAPGPSTWFGRTFGGKSRTAKEVKESVTSLLKEIVKQPETDASVSILESCADACRTHGLSLHAMLQEPSVEGRSAIYWAIIKHPLEAPKPVERDLISYILSLSAPLTETTISEIRLACLQNSNQALFQWLRQIPAFSPLTGSEEILLSNSPARDEIAVENVPGDDGAFIVRFRIMLFQRRMRVSKQVRLEFIARGRMWCLKFIEVMDGDKRLSHKREKPGAWAVTLSLLEHSPPTWLDSRLIIEEAPSLSAESTPSRSLVGVMRPSKGADGRGNPKPTISLRMKSGPSQLAPRGPNHPNDTIAVSLGDSLMTNSLQYDGSSYIGTDESLQARLEARLGKPDGQCTIC